MHGWFNFNQSIIITSLINLLKEKNHMTTSIGAKTLDEFHSLDFYVNKINTKISLT